MVTRRTAEIVRARLRDEPVIALQGPRAVGKTTLLRAIADEHGGTVVDLDDLTTRDAAKADPSLFVSGARPVCIDEYQHVPELLDVIKAHLNRDGAPGQFVLTGSTRHDALPRAAQALTGRLHLLPVYPLSQGELVGGREGFVDALFDDPMSLVRSGQAQTARSDYIERIAAGGFPLAVTRSETSRNRWFDDYITLSIERDVKKLARIQQRDALPKLLRRLAAQTAQMLNISAAGQQAGLTPDTAERYTKLLEAVFLVHRLPAWGTTLRARAVSTPKLHIVDSGMAARLLRLSPSKLAQPDATSLQQFGHLLETFIVMECLKQLSWMDSNVLAGHWRTSDDQEVDLVLEHDDGRVTAVEVKAGARISGKDLSGLRVLRGQLGDRFIAGVALYTGARSYTVDDRLHVLPVDTLWSP